MIRNFAASVRDRLYNKSKESGVEFQLLLARYAGVRGAYFEGRDGLFRLMAHIRILSLSPAMQG